MNTEFPDILPIEIPEKNIWLYLPLTLEKLDKQQYIDFFKLLYQLESGEIKYYEFAILAVYKLLGLKKGSRKTHPDKVERALSNIAMIAEYIIHFFKREENRLSLKLSYTHNHINEIKISFRKKLKGPSDYYEDVNFGQYEDGLNRFLQYNQTPSINLLAELAATFYLDPKGKMDFKKRAKKLMSAPKGVLLGFYYNFAAFHIYFSGSQVYYNGKLIDLSILFKSDGKTSAYVSPYPGLGIKSTAIEIASTGILGNLSEVRNTPLWEVALLLYDMQKKELDSKAKQELEKPK